MKKVLVIAPHPDDETIGCGGTLLKHASNGDEINWLIATSIEGLGVDKNTVQERSLLISEVSKAYNFSNTFRLDFPTTKLDTIPKSEIISSINEVFQQIRPEIIYVPYRLDVHSDHEVVFDAAISCCKTFRNPSVKVVRAYNTLSETEFGLRPEDHGFKANCYNDISDFFENKLSILELYKSEMSDHPFPRSLKSIRAQAILNGSSANCDFGESFITLKEIL